MTHIDLYRAFGLNPGESCQTLDQQLTHRLNQADPTNPGLRRQLEITRRILGDPGRRAVYDRHLAEADAPAIDDAVLERIAAAPASQQPPMLEPKQSGPMKRFLAIGLPIVVVVVVIAVIVGVSIGRGHSGQDTATDTRPEQGAPSPEDDPEERSGPIEVDPEQSDDDDLLRISEGFEYLSTPERIEPGAKYVIVKPDGSAGSCSFGWMARLKDEPDRRFNLTAGHCGEEGDEVYLDPVGHENSEDWVKVGDFVWQDFVDEELEEGDDYALIEFLPEVQGSIDNTPNIAAVSGGELNPTGIAKAEKLSAEKPYMCRLGYRSGLSCGSFKDITHRTNVTFRGITDHGDSGGVIWAFTDEEFDEIEAAAVTSWVDFGTQADLTNGKLIDPVVEQLGLEILKD